MKLAVGRASTMGESSSDVVHEVIGERGFVSMLRLMLREWEAHRKLKESSEAQKDPSSFAGMFDESSSWPNDSVGAYLEGIIRYAEDSYTVSPLSETPATAWNRIAMIMYAGREYD